MEEPDDLGFVTSASGSLILLDFGLIRMWSGSEPPLVDPDAGPPDAVAQANSAVDFEFTGPDAARVGGVLDLASVTGRWAFDVSNPDGFSGSVSERLRAAGLSAAASPIDRMPHLLRAEVLLADQPEGTEVPFHGIWAVAVSGVPVGRPLPVRGVRMDPTGPDHGRWREVWVECSTAPVARSVEAGFVLVEAARLLFADPTVLSNWQSDIALDGRADLMFWGRDADSVAGRVEAPAIGDSFGWVDLPVEEALERWRALRALEDDDTRFAVDFRPHDDHYRVLSRMRASATESGTIAFDSVDLTGFFTSWGDGAFPVFTDWSASGELVRFRVELGAPSIVEQTRRFERLWFGDLSEYALVSARIARNGMPVGWLYREETDRDHDSGWRIFAGDETDEYVDDPANAVVIPLREVLRMAADIESLMSAPAGSAFERDGRNWTPAPAPDARD